MYEKIIRLVEKVIEMKCYEIQEGNYKDMTEEIATEYEKVKKKYSNLSDKLEESLSKEQWELFNDLIEKESELECIQEQYMFSRGVKMGLNELSFIKEELGEYTMGL